MPTIFIDYVVSTNTTYEIPQLVDDPFTSDFSDEFGPGAIAGVGIVATAWSAAIKEDIKAQFYSARRMWLSGRIVRGVNNKPVALSGSVTNRVVGTRGP